MKLTKELFGKLDLYSDGYGNVADLSVELMGLMKENYDWPSNELTNKLEKELNSGKMILPKSRIKYYVENLSEAFLDYFDNEPAIAKLNNANIDWIRLLSDENVQEELQKKLEKNFKSNFKFEDEEFSIDERSYFNNEYDLIAEVILPKLRKEQYKNE